jgi:hypothetical protein
LELSDGLVSSGVEGTIAVDDPGTISPRVGDPTDGTIGGVVDSLTIGAGAGTIAEASGTTTEGTDWMIVGVGIIVGAETVGIAVTIVPPQSQLLCIIVEEELTGGEETTVGLV